MSWYNYLFAAIAAGGMVLPILIGLPIHASKRNGYGMAACLVLAAFWSAIFYWNVFA